MKFETLKIQDCLDYIKTVLYPSFYSHVPLPQRMIIATGGGAHKYEELIQKELQVTIEKRDEMDCLISGK